MTANRCAEMRLLIQADIDGDLPPSEALRVGAHLENCRSCAHAQEQLLALAAQMREEIHHQAAMTSVHVAVRRAAARSATSGRIRAASTEPPPSPWWRRRLAGRWAPAAFFASGFALASGIGLLTLPGAPLMADFVIADHIRALQPGHLIDIASADPQTVKPWFDGKLDFAPMVHDFAIRGYALAGGRLDYLNGRPVAALIYQHGQHVIDMFTWPIGKDGRQATTEGSRSGYNFINWRQNGMSLWAVSDLSAQELGDFARIWEIR